MTAFIEYLTTRRRTAGTLGLLLLGLIAAGSLVVDRHHAHTWAEQHLPFFWSGFGFIAAAAIIGFTRWFGRSGIQARPDFYDRSTKHASEEQ